MAIFKIQLLPSIIFYPPMGGHINLSATEFRAGGASALPKNLN